MAEYRTIENRYAKIAEELIRTEPALEYIRRSPADIAYLASDAEKKSKGRLVYGECEKVPAKYRWAILEDFTITIYEPNTEYFTAEQMKILLFHELLHIGIDYGEDDEPKYSVRPHDLEDFRLIADRFGPDWAAAYIEEE